MSIKRFLSPKTKPARVPPPPLTGYDGLDLLPSAILLLDAECRVLHGNPAAEALAEVSLKNLVGRPFREVFASGPEWERTLRDALSGQWSHRAQELVFLPAGRDAVPVACVISPAFRRRWAVAWAGVRAVRRATSRWCALPARPSASQAG